MFQKLWLFPHLTSQGNGMILWDGSRVPKQGIISAILSRKIASRNLFNIKRKIGNSHFSFKSILKDFFFFLMLLPFSRVDL